MEFSYDNIPRLSGWLGNPNWTGAFLAAAMAALWGLVWSRAGGRWTLLVLIPFAALGGLLIHTMSRGAVVALVAGMAVCAIALRRRPGRGEWIAFAVVLGGLIAYSMVHGSGGRFVLGIDGREDRSLANRWLIYRSVPAMFADAPGGWRGLEPQAVFHHFYQAPGRTEFYSSLVNSHATWMIQWPWWGRIAYAVGWGIAVVVTWPGSRRGSWYIAGLGCIVTIAIAAMFSSVLDRWEQWILPVLLLLVILIHRLVTRHQVSLRRISGAVVGGALLVAALHGIGLVARAQEKAPVRHARAITSIGHPEADRRILIAHTPATEDVLGRHAGHTLRQTVEDDARLRFHVLHQPDRPLTTEKDLAKLCILPADAFERLAPLPPEMPVILLNPQAPADREAVIASLMSMTNPVRILWGDLYQSPARWEWETIGERVPHAFVTSLPGQAQILTEWLDQALAPAEVPADAQPEELSPPNTGKTVTGTPPDIASESDPPFRLIDIEAMLRTQEKPDEYLIFDARSKLFYQIGHIPGAISLPVKEFATVFSTQKTRIQQAISVGKQVILYCQNYHCPDAKSLAEKLEREIQCPLAIYEGGWEEWHTNGLPTESSL